MSIRNHNPLMVDAFNGIYVIEASVDDWGFPPEGWGFSVIPVYYALDQDGKPTGATIDGYAWDDNTPENIAPPLKKFFESIKD